MKVSVSWKHIAKELHDVIHYVEKKCMHNLEFANPDNLVSGEELPITYNVAQIKDPRFPHMDAVAAVRILHNNGKLWYKITSRLIENSRFRKGSPDYHTKKTSEWEKAAKILIDVAKPYEFSDAMKYNLHELNSSQNAWREELGRKARNHIGYGSHLDFHEVMREIKNLLDNGVPLVTQTFRKIATDSYPHYEEYIRRRDAKFDCFHVYLLDDGRVAVSYKKEDSNWKQDDGPPISTTIYLSSEAIPEPVLGKYALLKMLGDKDKFIPEVGVRVSPREFYVIDPST